MRKLDRLDWAEGLTVSAFGVRVGIRVNVSGLMPRVLLSLPPGWRKSRGRIVPRMYSLMAADGCRRAGVRRLHVLYVDSRLAARNAALDRVLDELETDLHRYTAESASDMTFLHAGAVGWQGRAILFPGRSLSGKTTLVREILRLGALYYSDEYAVVDGRGRVHPFARPLGIREDGSRAQTNVAVDRLGATAGVEPLRTAAVVITEYQAGARWQPDPLSPGQGALELLGHSVAVRNQPEQTLSRVLELARRAVFIRGPRGEASEAAAAILHLASRRQLLERA